MNLFGRITEAAPATTSTSGFDQVRILTGPSGDGRLVARAEYEKMPLSDRIELLLQKKLRFYRAGTEIPPHSALSGV